MEHGEREQRPERGAGAERQATSGSGTSARHDRAIGTPATGAEPAATSGPLGEAGAVDQAIGRNSLGGTSSHHRASYSDPTPAAGERMALESDVDEATGHHTPGPGSPEWMRQPVDQTGFGAHVAEDANSRPTTMRDVGTGASRPHPERDDLPRVSDGDPAAG